MQTDVSGDPKPVVVEKIVVKEIEKVVPLKEVVPELRKNLSLMKVARE